MIKYTYRHTHLYTYICCYERLNHSPRHKYTYIYHRKLNKDFNAQKFVFMTM